MLFGERALGTLPDDLHKERVVEHHEVQSPYVGDTPIDSDTPGNEDVERAEAPVTPDMERKTEVPIVSDVERKAKVEDDVV